MGAGKNTKEPAGKMTRRKANAPPQFAGVGRQRWREQTASEYAQHKREMKAAQDCIDDGICPECVGNVDGTLVLLQLFLDEVRCTVCKFTLRIIPTQTAPDPRAPFNRKPVRAVHYRKPKGD